MKHLIVNSVSGRNGHKTASNAMWLRGMARPGGLAEGRFG
jgi:hypothetical protein